MEHKLNKVDVEIIQKVIGVTKEGRVQSTKKTEEGTIDFTNKKNSDFSKKQNIASKKIVVDAYKDKNEIIINAVKSDENFGGNYIDKKR